MLNKEQPLMILLTGPNGAGKTTFRQKFLESNPVFSELYSLNWDDETKKLINENPNIPESVARINAGRTIIEKTSYCFSERVNFVYETVATDKRHIGVIQTAKKYSYKIVTIFIGLSSSDLSKERVRRRVEQGGHNIPDAEIERRYPRIIANFPNLFIQSDTCFVIDNSYKNYKLILLKSNNLKITFNKFPNYLITDNFDITRENQNDGSILLQTDSYIKKTQAEKQHLIQSLLEVFGTKTM